MNNGLLERILDLATVIQQIPAPTFLEAARAGFVHARFAAEGLQDVSMDALGNVYGRLPGSGAAPPLVISAHMDTVFPASTPLAARREGERIYGPAIGDNSLGVAALIGLLWVLQQRGQLRGWPRAGASRGRSINGWGVREGLPGSSRAGLPTMPGDVWLVANVGEEGLGDLRGMRAVVDRFGREPVAYLVLEGMALGQVYHRGLGVRRYRITVRTPGGHSWVDYGRPSAVHELADLIHGLTSQPLPVQPRTALNVGVISGGTTVNTIAAEASLELDLRSEGSRELHELIAQVENLVASAQRTDVQIAAEVIGNRPSGEISPDHPLVRKAVRSLERQGIQSCLNIGSTDANIPLSRGLPAVCVGLTSGHGAHTTGEYINTRPLAQGMGQLIDLVEQVWEIL